MIDFVKLIYTHTNISAFIERYTETMNGVFNFGTGEICYPYSFKFEEYSISIRFSELKNVHYIEIKGSPHKNYFKGANDERFTYENLQVEIAHLCNSLHLEPENLYIQNLEVGVNICTPFAPFQYLQDNLLLYSTKSFKQYHKGKDGKELGYYCEGSPIVKLYDKGKQYDLPHNLMRFEIRFKKSKPLHTLGIYTLYDLVNPDVLKKLCAILSETWTNILLYESDLNLKSSTLNASAKALYKDCEHTKNWTKWLRESKSRETFYSRKKFLKYIIQTYGKNVHNEVFELIKKELEKCTNFPPSEKFEMYNITDTLNGKDVHLDNVRTCKSCGKPFHPEQSKNSMYCSAKYVGEKEAHKCRNSNSNKRNNARNKVKRLELRGLLFPVHEMFKREFINSLE